MKTFKSIGIIGIGLIGGSLSKSFYSKGIKLYAYDKSIDTLALAASSNIFEGLTDDLDEFLSFDLDLIYICLPVKTSLEIIKVFAERNVKIAITDAGSTKLSVQKLSEELKLNFCGGHPIAGKEVSGFEHSDDNLMKDAFHVLTGSNMDLSNKLKQLHLDIGMKVIEMSPERHDKMFGLISHMPHLMAYAIIELVCEQDIDALKYTGAGFRDFTRIAASDPKMWADIFTDNKEVMLHLIDSFENLLDRWKAAIENDDYDHMYNAISYIRAQRKKI